MKHCFEKYQRVFKDAKGPIKSSINKSFLMLCTNKALVYLCPLCISHSSYLNRVNAVSPKVRQSSALSMLR